MVDDGAQGRTKPRELVYPIVDNAFRTHDERVSAKGANRFEGFAETHIVGEHGAELCVPQEYKPVDSVLLVRPQFGTDAIRQGRAWNSSETFEQWSQSR